MDTALAGEAIAAYLRRADNYMSESLWALDRGGPPSTEAMLLKALAVLQPQGEQSLLTSDLMPKVQRERHLARQHLEDQGLIHYVEGGWELAIPLYRRWIRRYILDIPDDPVGEES